MELMVFWVSLSFLMKLYKEKQKQKTKQGMFCWTKRKISKNRKDVNIHEELYVIIMSRKGFRVNLHSIVAWISRNSLLETGAISEV